MKFFLAVIVAALWSDVFSATTYRKFGLLFRSVRGRRFNPSDTFVSGDVFKRRMDCCRACTIWYPFLETCGTPLKSALRGMGCYCHLPSKNKLEASACWLDEHLEDEAPACSWINSGVK